MATALQLVKQALWMCAGVAFAILAGCGGGGGSGDNRACIDDPNRDPRLPSCTSGLPPGGATAVTLDVLVSSPQLGTDATSTVLLTFRALDANRLGIPGRPVEVSIGDPANTAFVSNFSQTTTSATGTTHSTDANGQLTATLSPGTSKANRTITINAKVDGISASNTVLITGTTLRISGANALGLGSSTQLAIQLADSAGVPIAGTPVTVTSANGNPIAPPQATTDGSGLAVVTVTGSKAGRDTITATALGATANFELNVSNDNFAFVAPAPGTTLQAPVNVPQTLSVRWTAGGSGVPGAVINFVTTRGTLSASQAVTGPDGRASVTISSPFPGPAIVTATTVGGGLAASANLLFVATNAPAKIDLQADRTTVPVNPPGTSANVVNLVAVVRDAADNRVQGAPVTFQIEQDTSGGALTAGTAVTDANGIARSQYVPSANPSQTNGVLIRATLWASTGGAIASASIPLTVGGVKLFVRLGTDNTIEKVAPNYIQKWSAFVTDAGGNPVPGASVQFLLRVRQDVAFDPVRTGDAAYVTRFLMRDVNPPPGMAQSVDYGFFKGYWYVAGRIWLQQITARCFNEDVNYNGILDPGEDLSRDGKLQPGNAFSVIQTAQTNSSGFALAEIVYPQDRAKWIAVTLKATALVAGTEASESATFVLPIAASDVDDPLAVPPGQLSPYGQSSSCADSN